MLRFGRIAIFLLLAAWIAYPAASQTDQVFTQRGVPITGKVTKTSKTEVTINSQGANRVVSVNEIRRVNFKEDPPNLLSGRTKAAAGRIESALVDLKRVDLNSITRPEIKADLVFYRTYCEGKLSLSSGGDKKKAIDAMLSFVRKAPESHHFYRAAELLGDLSAGVGDFANAGRYYGAIASAPWPEFALRGKLSQARAYMAQRDFEKALATYQSVMQSSSDSTEAKRQKLIAQVGKGHCLAETGKPDEGLKLIDKVIADHDASDGELFGRAYNAKGACLLKSQQLKAAMMAYLHVDVLFYADEEIHAESLYHLVKLFKELKYPDRSVSTRNRLNDQYAGSIWANLE